MKLHFERLELQFRFPWRIASGGPAGSTTYPVVLLELVDAEGQRGLGEAASTSRYQQPPEVIELFLRRVDVSRLSFADIPGSMTYLDSLSAADSAAKCGLNLALVDGAAQRARQPASAWMGLSFDEGRHVTSFSIGIDAPEIIRQKVAAAAEYPVLKLKVGTASDLENFRALREAAPRKLVRVDANEGWRTREEALRQIEWLHGDGAVQFIEQPMPATTPVADWAWLKARSPLPIFGDESYHGATDAERAAECFHGVNVKLVKTGGVTRALEALKAARRLGLQTMIGCMIETSVLISAAAHLAELADYLDLDGNLLVNNDPAAGVIAPAGLLSFGQAPKPWGLRVAPLGVSPNNCNSRSGPP